MYPPVNTIGGGGQGLALEHLLPRRSKKLSGILVFQPLESFAQAAPDPGAPRLRGACFPGEQSEKVLDSRIQTQEAILEHSGGTNQFAGNPRFLPGLPQGGRFCRLSFFDVTFGKDPVSAIALSGDEENLGLSAIQSNDYSPALAKDRHTSRELGAESLGINLVQ